MRLLGFVFVLLSGNIALAQALSPAKPDNLPEPPPLPREMLESAPAQPPPDLPDPEEMISQLKQLEELLSLSPEKLRNLRQTLEFIEKMNLDEREAMRIRLSQITQMTASLRSEISELAEFVPVPDRTNLSQWWLASSAEERQKMRLALQAMSPDKKRDVIRQQVADFVRHRDEVFQRMKESLQAKQDASPAPAP